MKGLMKFRTEVLIVGGGATGVGIARDLSLRGIPCLLVEKGDLLSGASGRNHGLLHSGGRYVVSDPETAQECIAENRILRRIASHCIEETGGLFVTLPEDGRDYRDRFLTACEKVGLPVRLLGRDETLSLEPDLHPDLLNAIEVPDGAIDPFELVLSNMKDAEVRGAKFLLHTEVTALHLDGDRVGTVMAKDLLSGEDHLMETSFLINATGAWTNRFLRLAGLHIPMALSKGSMLITNQRLSRRVINRCRPPSDGDIVVPNHTVSILGTTSVRLEDPENVEVTPGEVALLIQEGSRLIPSIEETRFIRAYAGIRPLFQFEEKGDDRSISRGFILIDHETRDGVKNLVTITGGKLVTYRLMAEKAVDLICQKMGIPASCSTHLKPLPKPSKPSGLTERLRTLGKTEILCDCELVGREEIEEVMKGGPLRTIQDILHRTRLAKGTCQGAFCVYRLLGILHESGQLEGDPIGVLKGFLEERWKGIRPILFGSALKEEELIEGIYKGIFNL